MVCLLSYPFRTAESTDTERAMLRNPMKYPDPDSYRPERWLSGEWPTYLAPLTQYPTIKGMSSFGYGQRQCLGMSITQDELLLACGTLCWAFNLEHKVDPATGAVIKIDPTKSNSLLINNPEPYKMEFEPRSEETKQKLLHDWQEAETKELAAKETFLEAARARMLMQKDEERIVEQNNVLVGY